MSFVLDAGALIAIDRNTGDFRRKLEWFAGPTDPPRPHGGVLGQVWRGGARQARLASVLPGLEIVALDAQLGRRAGVLLAAAGMSDVIDAALVLLADDGDTIVTSDPADIARLAAAAAINVTIVRI